MATLEYSLELVTAPAAEPLSLTEAKKQVEVAASSSDHDDHLTSLIQAAREQVETDTRRALVTQTWEIRRTQFPGTEFIELPKPPLQSITHVKYIDTDGNLQTFSSSNYETDTHREKGAVWLAYNQSWPNTRDRHDAVQIRFVAGYGLAAAVPESAKQAMRLLIDWWFCERSPSKSERSSYDALVSRLGFGDYP